MSARQQELVYDFPAIDLKVGDFLVFGSSKKKGGSGFTLGFGVMKFVFLRFLTLKVGNLLHFGDSSGRC